MSYVCINERIGIFLYTTWSYYFTLIIDHYKKIRRKLKILEKLAELIIFFNFILYSAPARIFYEFFSCYYYRDFDINNNNNDLCTAWSTIINCNSFSRCKSWFWLCWMINNNFKILYIYWRKFSVNKNWCNYKFAYISCSSDTLYKFCKKKYKNA